MGVEDISLEWKRNSIISDSDKSCLKKVEKDAQDNPEIKDSIIDDLDTKFSLPELLLDYKTIDDKTDEAWLVQLYLKLKFDVDLEIDGVLSTHAKHIETIIRSQNEDVEKLDLEINLDPYLDWVNDDKSKLAKQIWYDIITNCSETQKSMIIKDKELIKDMLLRPTFYKEYLSFKIWSRSKDWNDWLDFVDIYEQDIQYSLLQSIQETKIWEKETISKGLIMHNIYSWISKKFLVDRNDPIIKQLENYELTPNMLWDINRINNIKNAITENKSNIHDLNMLKVYFNGDAWKMWEIFKYLLKKTNEFPDRILDKYINSNNDNGDAWLWILLEWESKEAFLALDYILSNTNTSKEEKVDKVKVYMNEMYSNFNFSNLFIEKWFPLLMKHHKMEAELNDCQNKNILALEFKQINESVWIMNDQVIRNNLNIIFWDLIKENEESDLAKELKVLIIKSHNDYRNNVDNNEITTSYNTGLNEVCDNFYRWLISIANKYNITDHIKKLNPTTKEWLDFIYTLLWIKIDEDKQAKVSAKAWELIPLLAESFPEYFDWNKKNSKLVAFIINEKLSNPDIADEDLNKKYIIEEKVKNDIWWRLTDPNIDVKFKDKYFSLIEQVSWNDYSSINVENIQLEKFRIDSLVKLSTIDCSTELEKNKLIKAMNDIESLDYKWIYEILAIFTPLSYMEVQISERGKSSLISQEINIIQSITSNNKFNLAIKQNAPDLEEYKQERAKLDDSYTNWNLQKAAVGAYHENISKEYFRDDYLKWKKEHVEMTSESAVISPVQSNEIVSQNINIEKSESIIVPEKIEYISSTKLVDPFDKTKSIEWVSYFDINNKLLESFLKKNGFDNKINNVTLWMNHDEFQKVFGLSMDKELDKDFFNSFVQQMWLVILEYIENNLSNGTFSAEEISYFRQLKVELLFWDMNFSVLKFLNYKSWKFMSNLWLIDTNKRFNFAHFSKINNLQYWCFIDIENKLDKIRQDSQKLQF